MFEIQSVRRSFPRNLAFDFSSNDSIISISQFEVLFERLFTIKLFQCFHIQMVVVPFLRNNSSAVVFSAIYIFRQIIPGKIYVRREVKELTMFYNIVNHQA
jgi:hypothetical protein